MINLPIKLPREVSGKELADVVESAAKKLPNTHVYVENEMGYRLDADNRIPRRYECLRHIHVETRPKSKIWRLLYSIRYDVLEIGFRPGFGCEIEMDDYYDKFDIHIWSEKTLQKIPLDAFIRDLYERLEGEHANTKTAE